MPRAARHAVVLLGLFLAGACASTTDPLPLTSAEQPAPVYDYPFSNPWAATVLGTPREMQPTFSRRVIPDRRKITVFPGREPPEGFWYHDGLYYSALLQPRRAPLVFVVAGTGADDQAGHMQFLGQLLYNAGLHVVLLPSPTHANFVVTGSSTFLPGRARQDAADLLRIMRLVRADIAGEAEVSDYSLAGYSLGAWNATFATKLDEEQGDFAFKRVLLINPPASLYRSIGRINSMLLRGIPGGINGLDAFLDQALARFSAAYGNTDALNFSDKDFSIDLYQKLHPSDDQLAGIVGLSFRLSSANMIFTSDVMSRSGYIYPKNKPFLPTTPLSDYLAVALRTSFLNYFDDIYTDYYQARTPSMSRQGLIEQSDLSTIGAWLARQERIGLLTNEDDVILAPGDLQELKTIFGARARVFPSGGHIGNLEHSAVASYVATFFTK